MRKYKVISNDEYSVEAKAFGMPTVVMIGIRIYQFYIGKEKEYFERDLFESRGTRKGNYVFFEDTFILSSESPMYYG